MKKSTSHVEPNLKGGWSVRSSGSSRASRIFETQDEAVRHAKSKAAREAGTLYVHGRDGSIREKRTFEKDA